VKDAANVKAELKGTIKSMFKPCNVELESQHSDGKNNEDSPARRSKSKDPAAQDEDFRRALSLG
jgi:hypothetical protein